MAKRDIVVIGGSAGGIEAVSAVVAGLPANLAASVFIVVHMPASHRSQLADILSGRSAMTVKQAEDGEKIEHGVVYVATPDRHLLLTDGTLAVARGPKENLHRPSVDVLFRSAAYARGSRVIGVILSGNLDDGAAGLWVIKSRGGIGIVQHPGEALFPGMPSNAIRYGEIDHVETLDKIPDLIVRLTQREAVATEPEPRPNRAEIRNEESMLVGNPDAGELGTPSYFTCPSCHGTLWEYQEGDLLRYRCRIGHAFSAESMETEQADALERALWVAIRTLDEKADLMRRLSGQMSGGLPHARQRLEKRRREAEENALVLRDMVRSLSDIHPPSD